MKKLILILTFIPLLIQAQDLTGKWQSTKLNDFYNQEVGLDVALHITETGFLIETWGNKVRPEKTEAFTYDLRGNLLILYPTQSNPEYKELHMELIWKDQGCFEMPYIGENAAYMLEFKRISK